MWSHSIPSTRQGLLSTPHPRSTLEKGRCVKKTSPCAPIGGDSSGRTRTASCQMKKHLKQTLGRRKRGVAHCSTEYGLEHYRTSHLLVSSCIIQFQIKSTICDCSIGRRKLMSNPRALRSVYQQRYPRVRVTVRASSLGVRQYGPLRSASMPIDVVGSVGAATNRSLTLASWTSSSTQPILFAFSWNVLVRGNEEARPWALLLPHHVRRGISDPVATRRQSLSKGEHNLDCGSLSLATNHDVFRSRLPVRQALILTRMPSLIVPVPYSPTLDLACSSHPGNLILEPTEGSWMICGSSRHRQCRTTFLPSPFLQRLVLSSLVYCTLMPSHPPPNSLVSSPTLRRCRSHSHPRSYSHSSMR